MDLPKINRHFVIFCGYFEYYRYPSTDVYIPWYKRFDRGMKDFYSFLGKYYYSSFNRVIYPELDLILKKEEFIKNMSGIHQDYINGKKSVHLTINTGYPGSNAGNKIYMTDLKEKKTELIIDFIDLYLLPSNVGIFAFKARINDDTVTFEDVSEFIKQIRMPETGIIYNDEKIIMNDFIENTILGGRGWAIFDKNNKLKSFLSIETDFDISSPEGARLENELFYELGSAAKIGTIAKSDDFSPSNNYYINIIENNKISIFKNWSALCFFDTFTIISNKIQDTDYSIYNNSELIYFMIYIHCIFLKFYLYKKNDELARIGLFDKKNHLLRDEFIEITNLYNLSHISYNFMPNEIYKKIRYSLDIDEEISRMKEKIDNINTYIDEKQDKTANLILGFLAFISLGSAIFDICQLLDNINTNKSFNYTIPSLFISLFTGVIILILILITNSTRKRKNNLK